MEYRVEDLARDAGIGVDTVRYYQSRGLLPPPRREGRVVWYDATHLERVRRIRGLAAQGFKLAQIARLLDEGPGGGDAQLLGALLQEGVGDGRTYSRAELAAEAGLPESLLQSAESAGLIRPLRVGDEEHYTEADLAMARAGSDVLRGGFPLDALVELAVDHARQVGDVAERAIDLFDDHVRKAPDGSPADPAGVTSVFRNLLPLATRLVALHFQRTLVTRALNRLEDRGDDAALRDAIAATGDADLEVSVNWR